MLCCLTSSLIFHIIYTHRPEFLHQAIVLFPLSLTSFSPVSQFFCHSLFIIFLIFSHTFCLVCLLSIFFQIFIIVLYNPICSCVYRTLHIIWSLFFCAAARCMLSQFYAFSFFLSFVKKYVNQDFSFCNLLYVELHDLNFFHMFSMFLITR